MSCRKAAETQSLPSSLFLVATISGPAGQIIGCQRIMSSDTFDIDGLCCPICRARLRSAPCTSCGTQLRYANVDGTRRLDLRAEDVKSTVQLDFEIPVTPVAGRLRERVCSFPEWSSDPLTSEMVRERYGTKIGDGIRHYLREISREAPGGRVLDLGCGSGGNRAFLDELGFGETVAVDWWSKDAEVLADAHRLPFEDSSFDLVLATAVLEHCYLPHLAMREAARVLRPGGRVLMGVSFWERWHSESYFHVTPNAVQELCTQADIDLRDIWVGWGFIPSVMSHSLSMRLKRVAFALERLFLWAARGLIGDERSGRHRASTAGSFGFYGVVTE